MSWTGRPELRGREGATGPANHHVEIIAAMGTVKKQEFRTRLRRVDAGLRRGKRGENGGGEKIAELRRIAGFPGK